MLLPSRHHGRARGPVDSDQDHSTSLWSVSEDAKTLPLHHGGGHPSTLACISLLFSFSILLLFPIFLSRETGSDVVLRLYRHFESYGTVVSYVKMAIQ